MFIFVFIFFVNFSCPCFFFFSFFAVEGPASRVWAITEV